jgi:2-haloacid dehalogenase
MTFIWLYSILKVALFLSCRKLSTSMLTLPQLSCASGVLSRWNELPSATHLGKTAHPFANGDQNMLDTVASMFSPNTFDHILSSETAGHYKPHPSVYDLPTTVLGIAKENIVHVAGSSNDVLGTISAGIRCIWSNRHADQLLDPAYPPTHETSNLTSVVDLIDA